MLPCVTAEAYSWADPENEDFGFKSGQENQTFVSWITFPPRYGRDLEKIIDWLLGMVSSSYWRSREWSNDMRKAHQAPGRPPIPNTIIVCASTNQAE